MICILKYAPSGQLGSTLEPLRGEIVGWIIATDIDDARRAAQNNNEMELAGCLYRMTFAPKPGRYDLGPEYLMLVQ
jgi:hypothetical protein